MELNEWVEAYINDEHTKEVYGKWAEEIALNKGKRVGKEEGIKRFSTFVNNWIKILP